MTFPNRRTVRNAWAQKLQAALVPDTVEVVYAYQKATFHHLNADGSEYQDVRLVVITGDGLEEVSDIAVPLGYIFLATHVFVLYAKDAWTEQMSENAIDDAATNLLSQIELWSDRTDENDPEWYHLTLAQRSQVDSAFDEGLEYRHEVFILRFEVGNQ